MAKAGPKPASIRIFLADGTADGLRIVGKSNWTGIGVVCSRQQYVEVRDRPQFATPGVYVLVGPSESDPSRSRIYVGEADVLRARINNHLANKDFWTRLVLFTSKDGNLNKADVRYLESQLVGLAPKAKRAEIENSNVPQEPVLSEADLADAESFLEEMRVIYPLLEVSAFELVGQTAGVDAATKTLLRLSGPDAEGTGRETSEGLLVYAGSKARAKAVPSIHAYMERLRQSLLADGFFVPEGDSLRLTEDYLFNSPSTAAGALLARTANGRLEWKDQEGRTLKEIDLAESAEPEAEPESGEG